VAWRCAKGSQTLGCCQGCHSGVWIDSVSDVGTLLCEGMLGTSVCGACVAPSLCVLTLVTDMDLAMGLLQCEKPPM